MSAVHTGNDRSGSSGDRPDGEAPPQVTAADLERQADAHVATVDCDVSVRDALRFLADGERLGEWALGSFATVSVGDGVVRGTSLFDGQPAWVRPVPDVERGRVDYHVGAGPEVLVPRIHAVVESLGAPDAAAPRCRIALHASRHAGMDDARWLRLVRCHEVEVLLIQARLMAARPK